MRILAIRRKKMRRDFGSALSLCFLVLYIAGVTSQSEGFHQFFHWHDKSVTHNEAQEKDPCHRSIYHDDTSTGCSHDSHVVVTDKCQLCDLISHNDQILIAAEFQFFAYFPGDNFTPGYVATEPLRTVVLPARAPPSFSIFS
jgi:hypothetical protein